MRFHFFSPVVLFAFLTGCANEGVVMQKSARPFPFYHSLGIDGNLTFVLQDRAGTSRRQMVTPEVFERYAIGQYFNDWEPGAVQLDASDNKTVKIAALPAKSRTAAWQTRPRNSHRAKTFAAKGRRTGAIAFGKGRKASPTIARRLLPKTEKNTAARKIKLVRTAQVRGARIASR